MNKITKLKKNVNVIYKMFPILKNNNIKVTLVNADNMFVGIFRTFPVGDGIGKRIELNARYFLNKNIKFIRVVLLHEIAHAIDFILSGGWRLDENGQYVEHDETFKMICDNLGIPFLTGYSELCSNHLGVPKKINGLRYTDFDVSLVGQEF